MGRPLEFDPDAALEAAMQLFWRRGYESSSLQDLLVAMGLSKSSFYQTFSSKHQLFQRCIERYREQLIDPMEAQLAEAPSGRAFLEAVFNEVAKETGGPAARRGCLLMNTASEFAQSDPVIADFVADGIEDITDVFAKAIERSQSEGEIHGGEDARSLASYLVCSMSGMRNLLKAGADRETIKRIVRVTLSAVE